jgi:hypothetical protein
MGLGVLLGGLALPLLGLVADEPAPFCCRGRCCCAGEATREADGRPCLRARCGCGTPDAGVIVAPLRLEAVLSPVVAPAPAEAGRRERLLAPPRPLDRPRQPLLPPPRRTLPA